MNNLKFQGVIFYHFIVSSRQTTHTSMGSPSEKNEPQYTLSPSPAKWLTLSTVVTTQCCLKRRNNQNEFWGKIIFLIYIYNVLMYDGTFIG